MTKKFDKNPLLWPVLASPRIWCCHGPERGDTLIIHTRAPATALASLPQHINGGLLAAGRNIVAHFCFTYTQKYRQNIEFKLRVVILQQITKYRIPRCTQRQNLDAGGGGTRPGDSLTSAAASRLEIGDTWPQFLYWYRVSVSMQNPHQGLLAIT